MATICGRNSYHKGECSGPLYHATLIIQFANGEKSLIHLDMPPLCENHKAQMDLFNFIGDLKSKASLVNVLRFNGEMETPQWDRTELGWEPA